MKEPGLQCKRHIVDMTYKEDVVVAHTIHEGVMVARFRCGDCQEWLPYCTECEWTYDFKALYRSELFFGPSKRPVVRMIKCRNKKCKTDLHYYEKPKDE